MLVRYHGWCLFCIALVALAGCNKKPTPGVRPDIDESHERIVAQSNELALAVYGRLREQPGNLVLSPYGVSVSLAMLVAGADGATRDELLAVLGASAKHEQDLHAAHGDLLLWLATVEKPREYELNVAGGIFVQRGQEVLRSFLKLLEANYDAQPHVVDFIHQPATARKVINDWAAEKTASKVDRLVSPDEISPQTRLILANAAYFKAAWRHAFQKSRTEKAPFHVSADKTVDVEMMHQTETFGYVRQDGVRVLIMPYRGEDLSMAVVLPDSQFGLAELEHRLDAPMLSQLLAAAAENTVRLPVWLPRFKFEMRHDLEPWLQELGATTAFDGEAADFSRIDGVRPSGAQAGRRLFVDRLWQQAMIEVDEQGTEAAAATAIEAAAADKGPQDPPQFRADYPFLFLIRENETGLILFLGRVVDPSAE